MELRSNRSYVRFPVDLECKGKAGCFQSPAGMIDMSQGGLRVHTGRLLIPGSLLHVFLKSKQIRLHIAGLYGHTTMGERIPARWGWKSSSR